MEYFYWKPKCCLSTKLKHLHDKSSCVKWCLLMEMDVDLIHWSLLIFIAAKKTKLLRRTTQQEFLFSSCHNIFQFFQVYQDNFMTKLLLNSLLLASSTCWNVVLAWWTTFRRSTKHGFFYMIFCPFCGLTGQDSIEFGQREKKKQQTLITLFCEKSKP